MVWRIWYFEAKQISSNECSNTSKKLYSKSNGIQKPNLSITISRNCISNILYILFDYFDITRDIFNSHPFPKKKMMMWGYELISYVGVLPYYYQNFEIHSSFSLIRIFLFQRKYNELKISFLDILWYILFYK